MVPEYSQIFPRSRIPPVFAHRLVPRDTREIYRTSPKFLKCAGTLLALIPSNSSETLKYNTASDRSI